jgi:phytoene synthase
LRDIKDDLERDRVYIPLDDLRRFGCSVDDLRAPSANARVQELVRFECHRARGFYRAAEDVRPEEDRGRLVAAEIMRAVYFETLRKIERTNYDVLRARIRVPRPQQAVIALRQWLWPR